MMSDLVSVIIPVYGVATVLDECIASIVQQTYTNLEIILIDDGSKDCSGAICDRWAQVDTRIKVIHQHNQGVSAARNAGLDVAMGKYISFVDGDDIVDKEYVSKLYNAVLVGDFALCSYYTFSDQRRNNVSYPVATGLYSVESLFKAVFFGLYQGSRCRMTTGLWLGLFKKEIIEQRKIRFDTLIRKSEDWLFYANYLPMCKTISIVNEPLYGYRQFAESVMHEYKVPTDLGIERSVYILKEFERIMKATGIGASLYIEELNTRYITMVKRYAIGVWDRRNSMSIVEKYRMLKRYTGIKDVFNNIRGGVVITDIAMLAVSEHIC